MYRAIFSRRARRAFLALPERDARRVKAAIEQLVQEPRGPQIIKLEHAPVAEYRRRVGNWRILFDIDDRNQTVEIVDIRRRAEGRYR
jgi:mRNA interferase RelE/StbE